VEAKNSVVDFVMDDPAGAQQKRRGDPEGSPYW
jgi:hypothetical protein